MSTSDILFILRGLPWTILLTLGAFCIGAVLGLPLLLARQSGFMPLRLMAIFLI